MLYLNIYDQYHLPNIEYHDYTIKALAISIYRNRWPQPHTRSIKLLPNYKKFGAFNSLVYLYKRRHNIVTRSIGRCHISTPRATLEAEITSVRLSIRRAFAIYGKDKVFNLDETPLRTVCAPKRSNCSKKKNGNKIKMRGDVKQQLTASLTISASGKKLCPFIIKKSKSARSTRCLNSLKLDRFPNMCGFVTRKGWTNEAVMVESLKMISNYCNNSPFCLVMDGYAAHWTETIVELSENLQIELIRLLQVSLVIFNRWIYILMEF
jgi:hypothetical protein